jgi:hypothetical protein
LGLLLGGAVAADAVPRPVVVELYTSEGCSSCPAAEAYIGELAQRSDVLALAFHVDYWDDLGWRDRFALPEAVTRQRAYAKTLRLSSIYTPQAVVDGIGNFVGSDRSSIGSELGRKRIGVPVALATHGDTISVDLTAQLSADAANAQPNDVLLIAYQRTAESSIKRGENAGRTIKEFNIVRALRRLGPWDGTTQRYELPLKRIPEGSTDVAVLIQQPGQGSIIGAATLRVAAPIESVAAQNKPTTLPSASTSM